jgi:hypothetical protein
MKTSKSRLRVVAAILLVVVVVLGLHWLFTGHRTCEKHDGLGSFSFEYPASYWRAVNNPIGVRYVGRFLDGSRIVIMASAKYSSPALLDPETLAERSLFGEQELLERHTHSIAGVPCIVQMRRDTYDDVVAKDAFFTHDGLAWSFTVYADCDHQDDVEAVFDHVFSTFEFLP